MFYWTFSNQKNRNAAWYLTAIIVVWVLVAYGIISKIYLLSFVVIMFSGVFLLLENNSAEVTEISLNETGLNISGIFYSWQEFSSFAVLEDAEIKILRLVNKKKIASTIDLPLTSDVNLIELKNFLQNILPENTDLSISRLDKLASMTKI